MNPIEFGSTDARQRGLCGGKGGARQKSGSRLATAFTTPLTPIPSGNSASEGEGKKSKKGEKTKTKKRVSPPVTPVVDGATGGHGEDGSLTDNQSVSGPPPSLRFTKESMARLRAHLGDGKGECECVVVMLVLLYFVCRCG